MVFAFAVGTQIARALVMVSRVIFNQSLVVMEIPCVFPMLVIVLVVGGFSGGFLKSFLLAGLFYEVYGF